MAEAVILRRLGFQRGVDGELICANPGVERDLIGANLETSDLLPPMSAFEYGEHHVDDAGSQILSASFTEQTISTMTGASGTNNMSSVRRQLVVPHHPKLQLKRELLVCPLCSDASIDHNKHHKEIDVTLQKNQGPKLDCTVCSKPTCVTCLDRFLQHIPVYKQVGDKWCRDAITFTKGGKPDNFICSQCEWTVAYNHAKEKADTMANMAAMPRLHDGAMSFPECKVLLASANQDEGVEDVLVLAEYEGCEIYPILHSVINQKVSIDLHNEKIKPDSTGANMHYFDSIVEVDIPDISKKVHNKVSDMCCLCLSINLMAVCLAQMIFLLFFLAKMQSCRFTNC